jgi:hypothetical protein
VIIVDDGTTRETSQHEESVPRATTTSNAVKIVADVCVERRPDYAPPA